MLHKHLVAPCIRWRLHSKGARVLYGLMTTSASTGSATVSVGISGSTAKYKALAAYTTADVPLVFGVTAGLYWKQLLMSKLS